MLADIPATDHVFCMPILRHAARMILWFGVFLLFTPTVGALTVDGPFNTGDYSSFAIVDGKPAVAWVDDGYKTVKFARAADAAGEAWNPLVIVDAGVAIGRYVQLRIVNGNPALCYTDQVNNKIRFTRALDATGTAWASPVLLNTNAGTLIPQELSLEIVDGNPAIAYHNSTHRLMYIRASDVNGAAWGAPVTIDNRDGVFSPSMKVVQGHPAIACARHGGLWYVRAQDPAGAAWGVPLFILFEYDSSSTPSLEMVNGRPAIAFQSSGNHHPIHYVRAADPEGASWGSPAKLATAGWNGFSEPSLAVVNGRPAIAYYDSDKSDLMFLHAIDSGGDTAAAWSPPVTLDSSGDVGRVPSLLEVNGLPAVVYHDPIRRSLKYLRALDGGGGTHWPPDLEVTRMDGSRIPPGSQHRFGVVPVGSSATMTFTLKNPNAVSADLLLSGWSIDGYDAAEFSITVPPATTTLAATDSTELTVICSPATPGFKFTRLQISHNGDARFNPMVIALVAETIPVMELDPAGISAGTGRMLVLPPPHPGKTMDIPFTIRNPGGAELNSLVITFDGPDAGEFSLSAFPAPSVPPGGSTAFTVRHAPLTAGRKSASLRILSNDINNDNPRVLMLRMIPGSRDVSFDPDAPLVRCIAMQPDGKILAGGSPLLRFLPNGAPDTAFFAPAVETPFVFSMIYNMAVQRDGKIIICGVFTDINGQSRDSVARLHPDGSLDESFAPVKNGSVDCIGIQPDGKILLGGSFKTDLEAPFMRLARFHEDGSLDSSFNPPSGGAVSSIALEPDGRILVGSGFEFPAPPAPVYLARLNPNGSLETVFPLTYPSQCFARLADGRVLTGDLKKFFADGTPDTSPLPSVDGGFTCNDLAAQSDGGCLVAGSFYTFGGQTRYGIARVRASGTLDPDFESNIQVEAIRRLALEADGGVLISRTPPASEGVPADVFMRLGNTAPVSLLTVADASTVRWLQGGTAPELNYVIFDVKSDDSSEWTPLGLGHRIPDGWELSGLTLPASGTLRAQGRSGGSLFEATASITTPLESWRSQYFHTSAGTGDAADSADPDRDGLANIVEFAFGLSPVNGSECALPAFVRDGDSLTAVFNTPSGREDVIYSAAYSTSLLPDSWTEIPDTGSGGQHVFRTIGGEKRVFVRFGVVIR